MPSRRDSIRMTDDEARAFLGEQRTVVVASSGPNGRPHLMPLWYLPDGADLLGWTFAKSQKAKNLARDPRATLQVEAGTEYGELRGVMLECDVALDHDTDRVAEIGIGLMLRYAPEGTERSDDLEAGVRAQAPKRVGLRFTSTRVVSWDHRKLRGTY